MTNPDKIVCQYPSCPLRARWFIYSDDPDGNAADVFLCTSHWRKGETFFGLIHHKYLCADFRDEGYEPLVETS